MDTNELIEFPGASRIEITFDERTDTEKGCDYIVFKKHNEEGNWGNSGGNSRFSGRQNEFSWPGCRGTDL